MPYVQRDIAGRIVAVSAAQTALTPEWAEEGSRDLNAFLFDLTSNRAGGGPSVIRALSESDLAMMRVVEDILDLLIERNLLRFTDLPGPAQEKLMQRRSLRQALRPIGLPGEADDGVI